MSEWLFVNVDREGIFAISKQSSRTAQGLKPFHHTAIQVTVIVACIIWSWFLTLGLRGSSQCWTFPSLLFAILLLSRLQYFYLRCQVLIRTSSFWLVWEKPLQCRLRACDAHKHSVKIDWTVFDTRAKKETTPWLSALFARLMATGGHSAFHLVV